MNWGLVIFIVYDTSHLLSTSELSFWKCTTSAVWQGNPNVGSSCLFAIVDSYAWILAANSTSVAGVQTLMQVIVRELLFYFVTLSYSCKFSVR